MAPNQTVDEPKSEITTHATLWRLYDSFLRGFKGPTAELDDFDCGGDNNLLMEHRNFEPARVLELLVLRASTKGTSPEQFHKDMRTLITYRIQMDIEYHTDVPNINKQHAITDLSVKYGVENSGTEPDSITFSRLCSMFPHYTVVESMRFKTKFYIGSRIITKNSHKYNNNIYIPPLFTSLDFSRLIPRGRILSEDSRRALILIHLLCLLKPDEFEDEGIPFRTQQILVNRRIQTSLLSDERRHNFLESHGIISAQGALLSEAEEAFAFIEAENPLNIKDNIQWNLFN